MRELAVGKREPPAAAVGWMRCDARARAGQRFRSDPTSVPGQARNMSVAQNNNGGIAELYSTCVFETGKYTIRRDCINPLRSAFASVEPSPHSVSQ